MESPDTESKGLIGILSVFITLGGILVLFLFVSLVIATWQAGLINFLFWSSFCILVALISKFVYHRIIESSWFE